MSDNTSNPEEKPICEGHKTNPPSDSHVDVTLDILEFDIFFDGTWNSRENSDAYNIHARKNANGSDKPMNQWNDKRYNPKQTILFELIPTNESISFARQPTGVDQLQRAFKVGTPHVISLYVDGSGVKSADKDSNGNITKYHGDSFIGAGLGWGSTGVVEKLHKMLRQIQVTLTNYLACGQKKPHTLWFNVYGFSRGSATARMFCHTIMRLKADEEIREMLDLTGFTSVKLKFVGLFDTVSSVGINHAKNTQKYSLRFDYSQQEINRVVHIVAGHEYRQKYSVVNIASAVNNGYGVEFAIPGCHTDIGDGLGTKGDVNTNHQWEVKDRDEQKKAIIERDTRYSPSTTEHPSSINPIQVSNRQAVAVKSLRYGNFEEVAKKLIAEGWYKNTELSLETNQQDNKERLLADRKQISLDYPKVAAYLMMALSKENHASHIDENKLKMYSLDEDKAASQEDKKDPQENKDNPPKSFLKDVFNEFKVKALALDKKCKEKQKLSYVTEIKQGLMTSQPFFDVSDKTLYNRYLHWSSSQKDGFLDHFIQVNIANFDNTTNSFYREVLPG